MGKYHPETLKINSMLASGVPSSCPIVIEAQDALKGKNLIEQCARSSFFSAYEKITDISMKKLKSPYEGIRRYRLKCKGDFGNKECSVKESCRFHYRGTLTDVTLEGKIIIQK